jgi:hypothetical protein
VARADVAAARNEFANAVADPYADNEDQNNAERQYRGPPLRNTSEPTIPILSKGCHLLDSPHPCSIAKLSPNRDPLIVSATRLTLLADLESDGVPTGADRDPTTTRISD